MISLKEPFDPPDKKKEKKRKKIVRSPSPEDVKAIAAEVGVVVAKAVEPNAKETVTRSEKKCSKKRRNSIPIGPLEVEREGTPMLPDISLSSTNGFMLSVKAYVELLGN